MFFFMVKSENLSLNYHQIFQLNNFDHGEILYHRQEVTSLLLETFRKWVLLLKRRLSFKTCRQSKWRQIYPYQPFCFLLLFFFFLHLTLYGQIQQMTDDIFLFFFFPENRLWHFMQIVSLGDNLHELLEPILEMENACMLWYLGFDISCKLSPKETICMKC